MSELYAFLPPLNRAEVTELLQALAVRGRVLETMRASAPSDTALRGITEQLAIVRSLTTAILEASHEMRRR